MKTALIFAGGVLLGGLLVARFTPGPETSCCQTLAGAVRDKLTDKLGEWSGVVYDELGLDRFAPLLAKYGGD